MGNQNSGHAVITRPGPPPAWTQSFPREAKRYQRYGALPQHKVLPERVPGQRLRTTENGRLLQNVGTINSKREIDSCSLHSLVSKTSRKLKAYSASTTALHYPMPLADKARSVHDLRFGLPPTKVYASEPDLRRRHPYIIPVMSAHLPNVICHSPTKGKIRSKKKHRAPVPPRGPEYPSSPSYSTQSPDGSLPNGKPKSRKIGLFKKKNESKKIGLRKEEIKVHIEENTTRSKSLDSLHCDIVPSKLSNSSTNIKKYKKLEIVYNEQPMSLPLIENKIEKNINLGAKNISRPSSAAQSQDDWERAEKEANERKKISETMQQEILSAAKKLRKPSFKENTSQNNPPKTFYFGMEPRNSGNAVEANSGLIMINNNSNEPNAERGKHAGVKEHRKISQDLEAFAVAIERERQKVNQSEEISSRSSRKEDGGYHSRQNSGSFFLETDNMSEDDSSIIMNLRPTLPRRHLDIPRFSPNAAWRTLSLEHTEGRPRSRLNESHSSDEPDSVFEDKIQRYTRPIAPPRGSGEKSADSGISGDAGSPGPLNEIEPLVNSDKVRSRMGRLCVSPPVVRQDMHRSWTPAEDLDGNSFDSSGDNGKVKSLLPGVVTPPKLTSRSNMFSRMFTQDRPLDSSPEMCNEKQLMEGVDVWPARFKSKESSPTRNLIKRSSSSSKKKDGELIKRLESEDLWRDNWSLTRSIPNSLNEEQDRTCNVPSRPCRTPRSRSETRTPKRDESSLQQLESDARPLTPSHLSGYPGHIMYLPEYNSRKIVSENLLNSMDGIAPSGEDIPNEPICTSSYKRRRGKKFSYQSTVRMLEKKLLEERLAKEVAEKERRRLEEVEAMTKVEQEFQKKREREKKKLKFLLFNLQKKKQGPYVYSSDDHRNSCSSEVSASSEQQDKIKQSSHKYSAFQDTGFHSLPSAVRAKRSSSSGSSKISEKKRSSTNSHSSSNTIMSSTPQEDTIMSSSRQEPDGAPASYRKNSHEFRDEIIAASRKRSADIKSYEQTWPTELKDLTECSKAVQSADSPLLTQELPELRQESREYKEYRSSKHSLVPYGGSTEQQFSDSTDPLSSLSSNNSHRQQSACEFNDRVNDHSRIVTRQKSLTKVDSSPARFAHKLLRPFHQSKNYKPVTFSPPPTKVLPVK